MSFDKKVVLERILEEAPILSNRRGEIEIESEVKEGNDWVKQQVKVPIYAYYFNGGAKDPELTYDKVNSPIQTTPDSTLAEVYSFWEEDPSVQDLRKRLEEEGEIKEGEVMYQGPWIEHALCDDGIKRQTREQHCQFSFFHSSGTFERHFNKIVGELGYDLRLIDLCEENSEFFDCGAYAVQSQRMIAYSLKNSNIKEGLINVRVPVSLNLDREDPTLSQMLEIIDKSYQHIHGSDFSDSTIYLG